MIRLLRSLAVTVLALAVTMLASAVNAQGWTAAPRSEARSVPVTTNGPPDWPESAPREPARDLFTEYDRQQDRRGDRYAWSPNRSHTRRYPSATDRVISGRTVFEQAPTDTNGGNAEMLPAPQGAPSDDAIFEGGQSYGPQTTEYGGDPSMQGWEGQGPSEGEGMYEGDGGYEGDGTYVGGGPAYGGWGRAFFGGPLSGAGGSCPDCGRTCPTCRGWCQPWYENLSLWTGAQGFKGPADQGRNGNFGFHEGINYGGALFPCWGIGYQVGFQGTQSNLSGSSTVGFTTTPRFQSFLTAGVFRRVQYWGPWGGGFQWGIVGDYLNDDYYVRMKLGVVRAEISVFGPRCHEFGFWTALNTGSFTGTYLVGGERRIQEIWQAQDLYSFFYRHTFNGGGQGRLWAGFTGHGDGIVGSDLRIPLTPYWALEHNFQYIIPRTQGNQDGQFKESWNISMNLVLYLGGGACRVSKSPWRPLFNVADNSTFVVQRLNGSGTLVTP